jgi:uncharacterized repeat protein (TIGR03803 family)
MIGLIPAGSARAQIYEVLGTVPPKEGGTPAGRLLALPDGRLLGSTSNGGAFRFRGSIFALSPDGGGGFTFEALHSFSGPDGETPNRGLILASDGRYYGTTSAGGRSGAGTIFSLDAAGRLTQLHDFADGGGTTPSELAEGSDGKLYGTSQDGGLHSVGVLFRIDSSGTFEVLHDFGEPGGDGYLPKAGLVAGPDGRLWGTTSSGGALSRGTVYAVDVAAGMSIVHSFNGADGGSPRSGLTVADGDLFGTTEVGGNDSRGTVFRITTAGAITPLHSFTGGADGIYPAVSLALAGDGNLYGVTPYFLDPIPGGLTVQATVFRITPSGALTTIFTSTDGFDPYGPLTTGFDGNLYGARFHLENFLRGGEIFRMDLTGAITSAFVLVNRTPCCPLSNLVESPDGGLYGIYYDPHEIDVLRLDPASGDFSTFYTFPEGEVPTQGFLLASDGNFYGTTQGDGSSTFGNVFRIDALGTATTLHAFSGTDGSRLQIGVVEGPGLELWGVASEGGANGFGTVFKVDGSGTFTPIHDFAGGADGAYPQGTLARTGDGSFYGTTLLGGDNDLGSIFRIDPAGGFSVFHSFTGTPDEGINPTAGLLPASDDYLYGTTSSGGANFWGTIYRVDSLGNLTTLHDFDAAFLSAQQLSTAFTEYASGEFYGVARNSAPDGQVFRTDATGTVTPVHAFSGGLDGGGPFAPPLKASDGALYGSAGAIYRLLPDAPDPSIAALQPSSGLAAGGGSVEVRGHHFREGVSATFGGAAGPSTLLERESRVLTLAPALPPGTLQDVTVEDGDGTTVTLPGGWLADFLDVPGPHLFHDFIETIFRAAITAGCGGGNYCPSLAVRRDQMAVFLLKSEHGSDFEPPPCTGVFLDVSCSSPFAPWVEQLAAEGITGGCGTDIYCPQDPVRRDQMAVFLLKTLFGSGHVPPACAGVFADVSCLSPFAPWIEELAALGITGGCGGGDYCPGSPNTRGQMAAFIVKTFELP